MQRVFLVTGANSAIANLWKVDDKAAKTLGLIFPKKVNREIHKSRGLKTSAIENDPTTGNKSKVQLRPPHYWAVSTLIGLYY